MMIQQTLNEALLGIIKRNRHNNNENIDDILELINKGADVNCQDIFSDTPLMWACSDDKIEIVQLLISKGADVNYQNKYGKTALDIANQQLEYWKNHCNQQMVEKIEKIIKLLTNI